MPSTIIIVEDALRVRERVYQGDISEVSQSNKRQVTYKMHDEGKIYSEKCSEITPTEILN